MKHDLAAALHHIDDAIIATFSGYISHLLILAHQPAALDRDTLLHFVTLLLVCISGGGIGACCGVLISAILPGRELCQIAESKRKIVNWCGAALVGPFIAWYASAHWFPEVPLALIGLAAGFLTGIFFVSVMCLIPWRKITRAAANRRP